MERVTTYSAYNSVISNLLQAENNQNQADVQVSSGKVASDLKGFGSNAEALTAAQSLKTRVDGYVQTATNVASQLTAQDTALSEVSDATLPEETWTSAWFWLFSACSRFPMMEL